MFEKFLIIYSTVITLNSAVKLNERIDLNKSDNFFNKSRNVVAEAGDTWHPIIQTRYWVPTNKTITPVLSLQQTYLETKSSNNAKEKHFKNNKNLGHRQNFNKQQPTRLKSGVKLTTQLVPPPTVTSLTTFKGLKIESQLYSLNKQNNNNAKENGKYQSHHQQHLSLNYNNTETQYPQVQISKDAKHEELTNPSIPPSLAFRYYSPQAKHIATLQGDTKNAFNATGNILPTTLDAYFTNKHLIDNQISNIKEHLHQNHQFNFITKNGIKSFKGDSNKEEEENVKTFQIPTVDSGYGSEEKLLKQHFNSSQIFEELIKDKFANDNEELSNSNNSYDNGNKDKSDVFLNDESANDDIDLQLFTSSAHQMVKATAKTISTATLLKNLTSFDVQNMLFSLASTAAASLLAYFPVEMRTKNETERANLQSTSIIESNKTTATVANFRKTPTFPLLIAPTLKSPTAVSSGRKIKKVKKKFQQFLLPLLLAYKLKFMALIPLLAGGLILLVGSTGLAGFFFALFAAVMSLKTGHGHDIIVKKY